MKPTDQQIEDCRVRGIVPGAVIVDVDGVQGTVWPTEKWYGIRCLTCGDGYLFAIADGEWATVITPAPKPATLTPGMACPIPSAAGRQWIKELAEEKGLWLGSQTVENGAYQSIYMVDDGYHNGKMVAGTSYDAGIRTMTPLHEFIRLLMEYEPPVPPKTTEELLKAIMGPLTMLARCLSQAHYSDSGEYLDAEDVQEAYDELKGIAMRMGLVTF